MSILEKGAQYPDRQKLSCFWENSFFTMNTKSKGIWHLIVQAGFGQKHNTQRFGTKKAEKTPSDYKFCLDCMFHNNPLEGSLTTLWFCIFLSTVLPWGEFHCLRKLCSEQMKKHLHAWSAGLQVQGVLPKQWTSASCTTEWLTICECKRQWNSYM